MILISLFCRRVGRVPSFHNSELCFQLTGSLICILLLFLNNSIHLVYSPFHQTLPRSSYRMHWISVRFYGMVDMSTFFHYFINRETFFSLLTIVYIICTSKFTYIHTMNYPKKPGFNLCQSRHCAYITYCVKTWF